MPKLLPTSRNRRFALAAVVYTVLIFSTLGVVPEFFNWILRLTGRNGLSITISLMLVTQAGLVLYIGRRALTPVGPRRALGLAAIGAGYGLLVYWADFPTSRMHALLYGVLALLVIESLRGAIAYPRLHVTTLALVMGAAMVDEGIQWLLPNRSGTLLEVLQNWGSAALAVAAVVLLKDSRAFPFPPAQSADKKKTPHPAA